MRRQTGCALIATTALITGASAARADDGVLLTGRLYAADAAQAVGSATVTLCDEKNNEISHATTDAEGRYALRVPRKTLHLPTYHHSGGGNLLGGLLKGVVGTAVSMINPMAGMGMGMAAGLMHGHGEKGGIGARGGSMTSNVDSARTQQTLRQMQDHHLRTDSDLDAIARGDTDALETVTPDAVGAFTVHVTTPEHPQMAAGLAQIYRLEEVTVSNNGKSRREIQGSLDDLCLSDPAEPSALQVKHALYVLREPQVEPGQAEYGQSVKITVRMDTPTDPAAPVMVIAHNLKTNHDFALSGQGGVYSADITLDKSEFARGEQTLIFLAYAAEADTPERSPKREDKIRSLGLWKLEQPFAYDPFAVVSRNRVAASLTVLNPARK